MTLATADPDPDPNPLVSLFRQCVARITDGKGGFRGTGFFAAPGQLVTCAHVAHGAPELRVQWQGKDSLTTGVAAVPPLASVTNPAAYPLPDLAVLSVEDGREWDHPCAVLAAGRPVLDGSPAGLYLAGYTVEHGNATALTGATAEFESVIREDGHEFLKLKRGRVLPGLSGSPLLDLRAGAVAGIVESSRGRAADLGGFAVPASTLAAVFPELAEENRRFHSSDTRWAEATEAERTRAANREGQRARLPLRPAVVGLEPDAEMSPATVLRPRHAFVGYVGRERLLADIAAWSEQDTPDDGPVQLWFVTGGGGFGKTRLAVEACRDAEARGWTAGLLPPEVDDRKLEALAEWPGRLLIAVDYAETRPALVGRLVEEMAARRGRPPVRVLLLVRRRSARADLLALFNEQREEQLDALLRRAPLSRLDEAASEVDRLELFRQAAADFGTLPCMPPPAPSAVPRLGAAHFGRPLYVLAAAYLRRATPATDVDALTETGLLRVLLAEHEAGHWKRWDQRRGLGLDPADQRIAVGLATLLTADGDSEALVLTAFIPHHGTEPEARQIAIARWLAQLYPPAASTDHLVISPLEPDRLGEVLVADLLGEYPDMLAAAVDAASDRQLAQVLTVSGRIARDDPAVREQLRVLLDQRLGDLLERSLQASGDEMLAACIAAAIISQPTDGAVDAADRFPDTLPVWLRPLAATITALAADGLRHRADGEPTALAELARILSNQAVRLGEVGRREEALAVSAEAVTIRRQLAEASPAAYLPDLATSLNNQAVGLSEVGRREEALAVSAEAVTHYRQLAEASPAAYLPDLATSLNNQANRLGEVGRREEALAVSAEAVTHYRQLAEASPAAYLPDLATSLNNQANRLGEVGRREEALAVSAEAVTHYRQLAEASPAAYLPDLATSLSNQAVRLSEVGRREEALAVSAEAVTIRRQLAEASPAAYLPDLATSLSNQAVGLSEVGRREEALAVSAEAVTHYRQLAEASPAAYLPDLATSLNNQASLLSEVGRREEALAVSAEAVTHYRQLAEASPAAYLPDLATSLNNQASLLSEVGRREEALAVSAEAVTHYRQLAEASPAAYLPDLATSLNNQANRLSEVGRREEALAVSAEAVTIRRQLAEASPAAYLPDLATSLNNQASLLSEVGRREEALAVSAEAVTIRRQLAEASPAAYLPDLATSLNNQASLLSEVGRREEALAVSAEAVTIRRQLAEASPAAYLPDLATSLNNQANLLSEGGESDKAEELFDQALGHFAADAPGIARVLMARGRWRLSQDRLTDAISDLAAALSASDDTRDYFTRGQVRQLLRSLRQGDQQATFDQAWQRSSATLPVWLQYPTTDQQLTQSIITWVQTPDWPASRTHLHDNAATLLTDPAEAAVEHLIDANPGEDLLRYHLQLLRTARAVGPDAAYDARQEENDAQYRAELLIAWLQTRTWETSQDFATANSDALLDPATQAMLATFGERDLRDPALRLHRGLLQYAAATSFAAAYDLRTDTARQASILGNPATPADTRLALARLHSGQASDDPEAHFQLTTVTLLAGHADEAAAALTDCADNAAPYEKRDFTRRLSEFASEHPPLAPVVSELQQILSTDVPPPAAADQH